ncbi:MAG: MarR family transcriptional regulator [Candidatus Thermoplasmatota archaeon]|jgi:predicted ArsR family transcriptional regulator|nr:MarR family transcriptional regulator [Candidatus Thermoplasmatota archaeon]
MIEITTGTIDEQIIKILLKTYPVTVNDLEKILHLPKTTIMRFLQKLQSKGILRLEPLPDKTYIRLLRHDFSFIGKKHQKKFIKHKTTGKKRTPKNYEGIMYT